MADVFISYSKPHRAVTQSLAKRLEARGLSVWWDTELIAGESFRHRIVQELTAAKAVIVIWTLEAVTSEYVLSEAERARVAKKLIQVRVKGVEPADLPPPFDATHVPLIDDERAVLGGLARLGVIDGEVTGAKLAPARAAVVNTRRRRRLLWPVLAGSAVALAAGGYAAATVFKLPLPGLAAPNDDITRASAGFGWFTAALNDGLKDTGWFAGEVRLGRRGLMTDRDAAALLREFTKGLTRTSCRIDPKSLAAKPDGRRPEAFRAVATVTCDLTEGSGRTRTERFPLEIEITRQPGGSDRITGLWQPEKMVLWQPRS